MDAVIARPRTVGPILVGLALGLAIGFGAVHHVTPSPPESRSSVISRDGRTILTSELVMHPRLWNATTGKVERSLEGHDGQVIAGTFRPDGDQLATSGVDLSIKLWNPRTGALVHDLRGPHKESAYALFYTRDGSSLVNIGWDRVISVWDTRRGKLRFALRGQMRASLSPDDQRLAVVPFEGTSAAVVDMRTGRRIHKLSQHEGRVVKVDYSPTGAQIATTGDDGAVKLWDARTGALVHTLYSREHGLAGYLDSATYSPDGRRLVTTDLGGGVVLWDPSSGRLIRELGRHERYVRTIEFSPDGALIASGGDDGVVKLYSTHTHELLCDLDNIDVVNDVWFSADGSRFSTIGIWPWASVWEVEDCGHLFVADHDFMVIHAELAADGSRLVTTTLGERTTRVWSVPDGELLFTLPDELSAASRRAP